MCEEAARKIQQLTEERTQMSRVKNSLTFSNVIALLALFLALGGTVYAAGKISGSEIKANSIPGNRIKKKTLTGNQVKPGSLTGKQVKGSTLTDVNAASLGTVLYVPAAVTIAVGPNPTAGVAFCPAGQKIIGGGATVSDPKKAFVNESAPNAERNGWLATGFTEGQPVTMTVTAICTPVKPVTG